MESTPFVQQLLNALGAGAVILDKDGVCSGPISLGARDVFEKDPAGLHFTQVLALKEPEAAPAKDWFRFLYSKKTRFEDICTLGPSKFQHSDPKRAIAISFKPIRNATGEVEHVIMVATDVTYQQADLKRAEQQRQDADMIVSRYRNFPAFARCLELYQECTEHLEKFNNPQNPEKGEDLRREIHSLKGILGICSITELVHTVKEVESEFLEAHKAGRLSVAFTKSLAKKLQDGHMDFMSMHAEALSLGRFAEGNHRVIPSAKVEEFRTWLKSAASPEVFARFAQDFYRVRLEDLLAPLKLYAALQGARLQKPVEARIECPEASFEPNVLDPLLSGISKAITTAIQESIEDVEERQLNEKPREGQITIQAEVQNQSLIITILDDGKNPAKTQFRI